MTNTNPARRVLTLGVLAGAYKGGRKSLKVTLTHSVAVDESPDSLCGNENMADEFSSSAEDAALPPTCPKCLRKDPRFRA